MSFSGTLACVRQNLRIEPMKSSLEIAQDATLQPIEAIAERTGLLPEEFEPYGRYKAKVALDVIARLKDAPDGKLVCVSGATPTKAGGISTQRT